MPGISLKVIKQKLHVNPEKKPVQQKRRVFAPRTEPRYYRRG